MSGETYNGQEAKDRLAEKEQGFSEEDRKRWRLNDRSPKFVDSLQDLARRGSYQAAFLLDKAGVQIVIDGVAFVADTPQPSAKKPDTTFWDRKTHGAAEATAADADSYSL